MKLVKNPTSTKTHLPSEIGAANCQRAKGHLVRWITVEGDAPTCAKCAATLTKH